MARKKRRAGRRGHLKWAVAALVICFAVFLASSWYSKHNTRIGVIRMTGGITDFTYADQVYNALKDPCIKAVVVVIDSPGGTVQACFETEAMLRGLNDEKPVVVTMGKYAASGAYLVSTASDHIFARNTTVTAGLGVIAVWVSYENKLEMEGIDYYVWKSGGNKDLGAEYRPPTEEESAHMQDLVDNLMLDMVTRIKTNRPEVTDTIDELMDGSTVYGSDALHYKLVDEIGFYEDAVEKAAELAGLAKGSYTVVELA